MSQKMPAIFFGHGSPTTTLADNAWTRGWSALGGALPRPRAVLSVSAHWYRRGCAVTATERPPTVHDFRGFPRELHEFQYPVPGDTRLAWEVRDLLAPVAVALDETEWGLDHGTWTVLRHVFPQADVPVVQLALDGTQPAAFHFALGAKLAPLRDEGVLVMGSGNLIHNLRLWTRGRPDMEPLDWAMRFEKTARELMASGEVGPLVDYETMGEDALLAIPTPDHYLPLLYVLALRREGDAVTFPVEGIDGGSVSMLTVRVG
jgi:4,5-DOPA dioxygenase extradiol